MVEERQTSGVHANAGEAAPCPAAGRWRFSLRGIFLITFVAALSAAEVRSGPNQWSAALFAIVSAVAAIGLFNQARDLRHAARLRAPLSHRQCWSVRFSVGWRVAVALLCGGWYLVRLLVRAGLFSLPDVPDEYFSRGEAIRAVLLYLLLLIAAGSSPPRRWRPGALGRKFVNLTGTVAAALLAIATWWQQVIIVYFVQVNCIGIAESGPLKFVGRKSVVRDGYPPFVRASAVGIAVCAMLLIVTRQLISKKNSSSRRWLLAALAVAGLVSGLAVDLWLAGPGLSGASPWMAEAFIVPPVNLWLAALIVISASVTLVAVRWRAYDADGDGRTVQIWLTEGRPYCHERVAWALLLATAAGCRVCEIFDMNPFAYTVRGAAVEIADHLVMDNEFLLAVVLGFIAIGRVWQRLRHGPHAAPIDVVEFDARRFLASWLLLFLLVLIAVPIVAAFSLALYFTRWYSLPPLDWS